MLVYPSYSPEIPRLPLFCVRLTRNSWLSVTVTKRRSVVVDEISPKSKWIKAQVFKKQFVIPNGDAR